MALFSEGVNYKYLHNSKPTKQYMLIHGGTVN